MAFTYIELFAGIGGFRQALDALGGKCVFASEIDPFATKAYKVLYGGAPELRGDITKIDARDIPDHDLLVGGFPCQAFSVAGQRRGFEDTRGTLFFEIVRIAAEKQPRFMLLENVKGLVSHDKGRTLEIMAAALNDVGYAVDFCVLNSKYFGVPQNRERIFIVCARDVEHADWNIVGNDVVAKAKRRIQALGVRTFNFDWPTGEAVTTRLRDILEDNVDERYYLSDEKTARLITQLRDQELAVLASRKPEDVNAIYTPDYIAKNQNGTRIKPADDPMFTLTAQGCHGIIEPSPIVVGSLGSYGNDQMNRVYSVEVIAPTLTVVSGGGREQKIAEPCVNDRGGLRISLEGVSNALDANYAKGLDNHGQRTHVAEYTVIHSDRLGTGIASFPRYRIRKLTPLECWRLQGFPDAAHEAVKAAGVSDSQRYKQAGNAVTVNVIRAIGNRLIPLIDKEFISDEEWEAMLA